MELFKILKFRLPYSLYASFNISTSHIRATRYSGTYINVGSTKPSTNFVFKAAMQWNILRIKLGILDFDAKINSVKNNLKSMILSNQCSGTSTEWNDQNNRLIVY